MSATEIRLGTRGSQLALWQARTVAARITETGGPTCRIVTIKTAGDRLQDAPLSELGGKRLFVKEIEDALLRRDIDIAVHSSKDMPALMPEGLAIAAVLPREDPRDAVVLPQGSVLGDQGSGIRDQGISSVADLVRALGPSPSIGTGSVRRVTQLMRLFPGARFAPIRGNLDTRLRKLDAGDYDALVLAAAGLRRLGLASRISLALPAEACIPAPGQGIVAIEVRADDDEHRRVVARIDDVAARIALTAERALVEALGGGCQTPIGALAIVVNPVNPVNPVNLVNPVNPVNPVNLEIELVATVVALDGSRSVRASARGSGRDAAGLGARVAARLRADGALEILAEARATENPAHDVQG